MLSFVVYFQKMGTGWSSFSSTPTRGRTSDNSRSGRRERRDPPSSYPSGWNFYTYDNSDEDPQPSGPSNNSPQPENEPSASAPLKIKGVDFKVKANAEKHHTDEYDIVEGSIAVDGENKPPQLVVRRGHSFEIALKFDRDYNKRYDVVSVVLEIGPKPRESKRTLVYLDFDGLNQRDGWASEIKEIDGNFVSLTIKPAPDCIIGIWDVEVHSSLKKESSSTNDKKEINRYLHKQPIYILFNPWCKEDTVYLDDDRLRAEYVLNDKGRIYVGSFGRNYPRPWNFGQFDGNILDCSMYLLDEGNLNFQGRNNPISVSRSISAMVNIQDDNGVLVGNWSGDYSDGKPPTSWVGSVKILEEYFKKKKPIKFGQCWVYSGLVTTVSRAIGLPCRSVTNFSSAHDTDGSISIDKHLNIDGQPARDQYDRPVDTDSIWNFHVWNEGWMARRDLPSGFGGWQAFDATPQETSDGIYRAGPASVKAIKEGYVNHMYDGPFIFAEVNADVVYWKMQQDGKYKKLRVETKSVGKAIKSWPEDDITSNYKHKENTEEERAAVYRANLYSTNAGKIYGEETGIQDINFQLKQREGILVGSNFNVVLQMQNTSRERRTVHAELAISPVYYTGAVTDASKPMKFQSFDIDIDPVKTKEAVMLVLVDDYINKIVEQVTFEISVYTSVKETEQEYATRELYRLVRPDLIITAPSTAKVAERVTVKVKLESPMPKPLTECEWDIEGAHLTKPIEIKQDDMEPFEHVEISVDITPMKAGKREIVASFTSRELQDVTGAHAIEIIN